MPSPTFTHDELLDALRHLEKSFGRVKLVQFCREMGVSTSTIWRRFGSWNAMRLAAGLAEAKRGGRGRFYTAKRIVEALYDAVDRHGPGVTLMRFLRETGISTTTIERHCGGWSRLREQVGLKPNLRGRQSNISDQDLWDDVVRVSNLIRRPMTWRDLHAHGRYGRCTYQRRLGRIADFDLGRLKPRRLAPHEKLEDFPPRMQRQMRAKKVFRRPGVKLPEWNTMEDPGEG